MLSVSVILLSGLVVSHIQRLIIFTYSLFELGGCVCGEHLYLVKLGNHTTIFVPRPMVQRSYIFWSMTPTLTGHVQRYTDFIMMMHDHHVLTLTGYSLTCDQRPESILKPFISDYLVS